jgi:formylglycine-generating enzyme required for sulfatase activity
MPVLPGSLWSVLGACILLSAWTGNSSGQEVAKKPASSVDAKPGEVITNSIGMKLVLIPPGSFTMGSPADEPGRMKDENQVAVTISQPYFLGVTEVTQGQWTSVMGTTPWKGRVGVQQGPKNPATYVTWDDAVEFCKKLSENEAKTYRLPTEAEWEYACRAGSTTAYSFGDDATQLSEFGWWGGFRDGGNTKTEKYAHLVAQKPANRFGLYDMHGNVMEWCSDWYGKGLVGGRDPQGADSGVAHVYRGGGCDSYADDCRSAFRLGYWRYLLNYDLGFRVSLQAVR